MRGNCAGLDAGAWDDSCMRNPVSDLELECTQRFEILHHSTAQIAKALNMDEAEVERILHRVKHETSTD